MQLPLQSRAFVCASMHRCKPVASVFTTADTPFIESPLDARVCLYGRAAFYDSQSASLFAHRYFLTETDSATDSLRAEHNFLAIHTLMLSCLVDSHGLLRPLYREHYRDFADIVYRDCLEFHKLLSFRRFSTAVFQEIKLSIWQPNKMRLLIVFWIECR